MGILTVHLLNILHKLNQEKLEVLSPERISHSERVRLYRSNRKEYVSEYMRKYYQDNIEKHKQYYLENKAYYQVYYKEYHQKNKERFREYYSKNKEKYLEYFRKYKQTRCDEI